MRSAVCPCMGIVPSFAQSTRSRVHTLPFNLLNIDILGPPSVLFFRRRALSCAATSCGRYTTHAHVRVPEYLSPPDGVVLLRRARHELREMSPRGEEGELETMLRMKQVGLATVKRSAR